MDDFKEFVSNNADRSRLKDLALIKLERLFKEIENGEHDNKELVEIITEVDGVDTLEANFGILAQRYFEEGPQ